MSTFRYRFLILTFAVFLTMPFVWGKNFAENLVENWKMSTALRLEKAMSGSSYLLFPPPPTTVSVRVSASSDDAEQNLSSGAVNINSIDLELAVDGSAGQLVGMRFNGINIPQGATITSAYVEFETDAAWSTACNLTIQGQAADNPTTFVASNTNLSARSKTSAAVSWSPAAWNTVDEKHQTPDLITIIQEIVNRSGWASGNSMVVFVQGTGTREAESYDGEAAAAPLLVVEYSTGGACPNLITNHEFDSGVTDWDLYQNSGAATFSGDNTSQLSGINAAKVNVTTATGTDWHIQFAQTGKSLVAGQSYTFSFQAKAASNRQMTAAIDLGMSPWTNYFGQIVNLTTAPQTFTYTFVASETRTNIVRAIFNLGVASGNVWIDDVTLSETCASGSEICNNGIDDDGDGLVDSADPDCISFCDPGSLTLERWNGVSGTSVSSLTSNPNYPNSPSYTGTISSFDGPDDVADNYGTRVRGYIAPTVTGTYSFNVTGDDDCSLYLSTDAFATNKVLIASFSGFTGTSEFTKFSSQTSANITLTAGQKYYVELLHKEGSGGDHFQVYWKTPSSSTWTIVPGTNLIPFSCPEICGNGIDDDGDGLVDCFDSDCGSVVDDLTRIVFSGNASIESGTEKTVNAVYRFVGVDTGIDALVTIDNIHNVDSIRVLFQSGFEQTVTGVPVDNPYMDYTVRLVDAGTTSLIAPTDLVLSVFDIDGLGSSSRSHTDYAQFYDIRSFVLSSSSKINVENIGNGGYKFSIGLEGGVYPKDSTGVDPDFGIGIIYENVNTFSVQLGTFGPNTLAEERGIVMKGGLEDLDYFGLVDCIPVEICDNGIDDDGDGLIDGADPDCISFCDPGSLTLERWNGVSGTSVSSLTSNPNYPNTPSYAGTISSFDGPDDVADNYGTRVRGYIAPTVTGTYSFNVTGDDDCSLYLSTDAFATNKVLIASFSGFTGTSEFTKFSSQTSANITLTAGQKYYVELLHKEGSGGDHFQVYWKTPSSSTWTIVSGTNLIPFSCPEICNNGIDDDGDGLTDSADPDCQTCSSSSASTDIPKTISSSGTPTITSTINITETNLIEDINLIGLDISHSYISDLTVSLTSPAGTTITLLSNPCNSEDNILISFDDEASSSSFPCPPTNGMDYIPQNPLSGFDGEAMNGTWTLTVSDAYNVDGGSLNGWGLEITYNCSGGEICNNGIDDDGDGLIDCADPNCGPTANAGTDQSSCSGENVTLTASASGGGGGYSYAWSNGLGSGTSKTVSPISPTTYIVTVTDANGCTDTDQITVNASVSNCAEICGNGIDDDGDGLIDNADSDCSGGGGGCSIGVSITNVSDCINGMKEVTTQISWGGNPSGTLTLTSSGVSETFDLDTISSPYVSTLSVPYNGEASIFVSVSLNTGSGSCSGGGSTSVSPCGEICGNGIDDDGDGLIDGADPECSSVNKQLYLSDPSQALDRIHPGMVSPVDNTTATTSSICIGAGARGSFSSPTDISNQFGEHSLTPDVAVYESGAGTETVHMVFHSKDPSASKLNIYYSSKTGAGSWSAPVRISSDAFNQDAQLYPSIAVDANNKAHVVYAHKNGASDSKINIYYVTNTSGSWSSPVRISDDGFAQDALSPEIALDANGKAHVAYNHLNGAADSRINIYYVTNASGSWSSPSRISNDGFNQNALPNPAIAVDGANKAHVAYTHKNGASDAKVNIYYVTNTSGSWSSPARISNDGFNQDAKSNPSIATDENNQPHVVYIHKNGASDSKLNVYYVNKTSGSWSSPQNLSNDIDGQDSADPDLYVSGCTGLVRVAFTNNGVNIYYTENSGAGNSWVTPTDLNPTTPTKSTDGSSPAVAMSSSNVHVVFSDKHVTLSGDIDVWHTSAPVSQDAAYASTTFTQSPTLCSALTIKSGETITVTNYVNIVSGTMPGSPNITAVLRYGATNIITLNNPTYNSGAGTLTWTGTLGSDVTVPASQAIALEITTNETAASFQINYDSQTYPSHIDLPVSTYINIASFDIYDAPYPGGSIITSAIAGDIVYPRALVSDPFGFNDITGLDITITPPGTTIAATSVATSGCTRRYEYVWNTTGATGAYTIQATAKEGYENAVTDVETATLAFCTPIIGNPVFALGGSSSRCQAAGTVTYAATSTDATGVTYSLDATSLSNGNTINSSTGSVTFAAGWSGTSTITATAAGCGGPKTATHTVTIGSLPTPNLGANQNICPGSSATMTPSVSAGTSPFTFTWNNGLGTGSSKTVSPSATTTYNVTVTDALGCTGTDQVTVSIIPCAEICNNGIDDDIDGLIDCADVGDCPPPVGNISGTNMICQGSNTTLNVSGGVSYLWSTGATANSITVSPSTSTNYSVTVSNAVGCTSVASYTVTVIVPNAVISGSNTVCEGESTILTASGGDSYVWSTGENTPTILVSPTAATTYTVTITTGPGCIGTASQTVTPVNCVENCSNGVDDNADGLVDCNDPFCQRITLSNITVGACIDHPLQDVTTVSVDVSWVDAPTNDIIEVNIFGKTEYIPTAFLSSPQTVTFTVPADGSAGNSITASWQVNTSLCAATITYDAPVACSSDEIVCDILYLCGEDKPYDGDAWDHGWLQYLDAVNGSRTLTAVLTKPDGSGLGMYDPNNPTTPVSINFVDYDLIIISATTEAHISNDLVNALKDLPQAILNSNYKLINDLGMSASEGFYQFQTHAYIDNTTLKQIYNYNNVNPSYSYVFTKGDYAAGASAHLWTIAGAAAAGTDGIYFVFDGTDALSGVASTHGKRIYLGYHMNGVYANADNGGALPAPVESWFDPARHLTLDGKYYFDHALTAATGNCDGSEICNNGSDDDGDGLVDCNDPDCNEMPVGAVSATYRTIADGNWNDVATWQGGSIPPIDGMGHIDSATISIEHHVTLQSGKIELRSASKLWVTNGSLTFNDGDFKVDGSTAIFSNAALTVLGDNNVEVKGTKPQLYMTNCTVDIGKDFKNNDGIRYLENVCLTVAGGFACQAKDSLINVCASIGANVSGSGPGSQSLKVDRSGQVYIKDSEINLIHGDFEVKTLSFIYGDNLKLWIQDGELDNKGFWTCDITQYCVSENINVSSFYLPPTEECSTIPWYFSNCDCGCSPTPEVCSGGIDEDGDGLFDCEDDDCSGTVYVGEDLNSCSGQTVTLTAYAFGDSGPYTFAWSLGLGSGNSVTVNPANTTTYTVSISNSAGCTAVDSVTVTIVACPEICTDGIDNDGDGLIDCDDLDCTFAADGTTTAPICAGGNDGTINLNVLGGKIPHTFSWSNGATTEDLSGVTAGNYTVTITDNNGCTATRSFTVADGYTLLLSGEVTNSNCYGDATGTINLSVTGGVGPYNYAWSNGEISQDLSGLAAGIYGVTVSDANGCNQTGFYTILQAISGTYDYYYIPLPETNIHTSLKKFPAAWGYSIGNTMRSIISMVTTEDGNLIFYDHWEDGYEVDILNPTQPTTEVWGDENPLNGIPPGYITDLLTSGDVIGMDNTIPLPRNPSQIYYDGKDKIASSHQLALSRAAWAPNPGPVLSGAVDIMDVNAFGKNYEVPIGEDIPSSNMFEYTSLLIMAQADNTIVWMDDDGNGVPNSTHVLNEGETYQKDGGIQSGARVTSSKAVQAHLITGNFGGRYENRWFTLFPKDKWDNSYFAPVGTTVSSDPAHVFIYNPNNYPITVNYETKSGNGSFNINSKGVYRYAMPMHSGAHFYTNLETDVFFAISTIDSDSGNHDAHDWGYNLVPESYLTISAAIGWGPGNADLSGNGSPAWVIANQPTRLYVDYDGDPSTGSKIDPAGGRYDVHYDLTSFESKRIYDNNDNDQTGMFLYTLDGTLISAAWGQDPETADPGNPYLDFGTTVPPIRKISGWKDYAHTTDVNGNGLVDPGDEITFYLNLKNAGNAPVLGLTVFDPLPPEVTYVPNTTYFNNSLLADNTSGTLFPVDELGFHISSVPVNTTYVISFRTTVNNMPPNFSEILNSFSTLVDVPCKTIESEVVIPVVIPPVATNCTLTFANVGGSPVSTYQQNTQICISVTDADRNTSDASPQTIQVSVQNTTQGDTETVTLTETGNNTGVFRGCITSSNSTGQVSQNGTLYALGGHSLTATSNDAVNGDNCSDNAVILTTSFTKQLYLSEDGIGSPDQDLDRNDPVATGDATTATSNVLSSGSSTVFTQAPDMCQNFNLPAGGAIGATFYVNVTSGSMPANPNITAVLRYGATNIITLTNPTYSGGALTFSGALASNVTVPAGSAIELQITSNQAAVTFVVEYDSQTRPSRVDLPTTTVISVEELGVYSNAYPAGVGLATLETGQTVYIRSRVSDPFGYYDISNVELDINYPGGNVLDISMPVVSSSNCTSIVEYAWSIPSALPGPVDLSVVAFEGFENAIFDTVQTSVPLDTVPQQLPCALSFMDASGNLVSGYLTGEEVCVQLDDSNENQDDATIETVFVQLTGSTGDVENVVLTETGNATGIFTGCIISDEENGQTDNDGILYAVGGNSVTAAFSQSAGDSECSADALFVLKTDVKPLYLTTAGQGLDRVDPVATRDTTTASVTIGGSGGGVTSLSPSDDTYISSSNSSRNYGSCTNLDASAGSENIFLKFDLTSIPNGATIISADLKLRKIGGGTGNQTINIYRATNTWTENSSCNSSGVPNWNVRTGSTNWTNAGGDFNTSVIASNAVSSNTQYAWDIQSLVQGWADGTYANEGLVVYNTNGSNYVEFASKEYTTADWRPELAVSYSSGSSSSGGSSAGWSYLWNQNSAIGNESGYVPLEYNSNFYNVGEMGWVADAANFPASNEANYARIWGDGTCGAHPGKSVADGASTDRFAIVAYTVGSVGTYAITNSSAQDDDPTGGDQELRVYVNNNLINTYTVQGGGSAINFNNSLGSLSSGDKIYVAVGPDAYDAYDGVLWDFSITLNGSVIADLCDDFSDTQGVTSGGGGSGSAEIVTFDNASYGTLSNASSTSFNHTTGTGSNRLMLVSISAQQPASSITSVKYDNMNLTHVGTISNSTGSQSRVEIWRLLNPSSGTNLLEVTGNSSENGVVGVATFSGVNQTSPLGTFSTAQGSSATASVTTNSANDELVFAAAAFNSGDTNLQPGTSQTEYWDATVNSSIAGAGGVKDGSGTVTMSWTNDFGNPWSIAAVSIKPAQNGGGGGGDALGSDMAIWSSGASPEYNLWDGSSFGTTQSAVTQSIRWRIMQGASSPTRDEKIVIGVESGGEISGELWNGSTWDKTDMTSLAYVNETYWWVADVAYESQSGDAMIVWSGGNTYPNQLRYQIWDGSSWSAPASVPAYTGVEPKQIKLAANPTSDEMVVIVNDNAENDWALVWNGSSWSNQIILDNSTGQDRTDINVAYESQSGRALVLYNNNTNASMAYRIWDGSSWGSESTISAPSGPDGYARWSVAASSPASDHILLGVTTSGSDAWATVWDGSAWETAILTTPVNTIPTTVAPTIAVAFESQTGEGLVVTAGTTSKAVYKTWEPGTGWVVSQTLPFVATFEFNSIILRPDPVSDAIMFVAQDGASDLNFMPWDGSSWGSFTELETSSGETKNQPFEFLWSGGTIGGGGGSTTGSLSRVIISSSDDAEQFLSNNAVSLTSSDLELINDSGTNQKVGMRFQNITIPAGAIITNAIIEFTNYPSSPVESGATSLVIAAEDTDNASTFTSATNNIGSRTSTTASVNWNMGSGTNWGVIGDKHSTPDLSAVIQEIVDRPGWASGNSIAFLVSGSGERSAFAYDGSPANAPKLGISYEIPENPGADCTDQTLTVIEDASLFEQSPNYNYGTTSNFQVGAYDNTGTRDLHTVMKFDVSGLSGQTIGSAVLNYEVRSTYNAPITIEVHRLNTDWSEGTVTWNSPWTTAGGDFAATVVGSSSITSAITLGDPTETMSIDITSLVQDWADGTYPNYGLVLIDPTGNNRSINAYASEGLVPPTIEVTACTGGGGTGNTSVTFTQTEPMCTDLDMPAGGVVQVKTYVRESGGFSQQTYLDEFSTVGYNSNDGTLNWSGNWSEMGDDGLASTGNVRIESDRLRFNYAGSGASRGADLSGTTSATLTFNFHSVDNGNDQFIIEASSNGGTSYTQLEEIMPTGTGQSVLKSYNLEDFISLTNNVVIRFKVSLGFANVAGQYASIDNVQIAYDGGGGSIPTNPDITAVLKHGATTFATLNNPVYDNGASTLTWSQILGSNYTLPAGDEVSLDITQNDTGYSFDLLYDSQTKPSKIDLPTQTIIKVEELAIYDNAYAGGTIIEGAENGETVYIRTTVSDPFGPEDVTSLDLTITSPSDSVLVDTTLYNGHVVGTAGCEKIYEYAWTTGVEQGLYQIDIVAHEGYEGIFDEASTEIEIQFDDFGSPCQVAFTNGGAPTTSYNPNDLICIQVTDIDENADASTADTITVTVTSASGDSESIEMFETGISTGIFTACIPSSSLVAGSNNNGTLYAPMGDIITLTYADKDMPADECTTTVVINSINPDVDISIRLIEPADGVALVGEDIRFDITVSNTGPTTLTSLLVNNTFNASQLSYVGSSLPPDIVLSGSLIWNFTTTLAPGGSFVIEVYFTGAAPANPAVSSAEVSGSDVNAAPVNAGPVTDDVIITNPLVTVDKYLTAPAVGPYVVGDTLTFQIDITNTGTTAIMTLPLSDDFSAACLQFVDAVPAANGAGGGTAVWDNLGPLATSASISVTTRFVIIGNCNPVDNRAAIAFAIDENDDPVPPVEDLESLPVESPPIAEDDFDSTGVNTAVTVDVLVNDFDYNDNLDTASVTTVGVLQPSNGTVTAIDTLTGEITYLPNAGFTGVDVFEYIICDQTLLCDTALVTITIINEDCSNGIDDDGDGLIDCNDPDCTNYNAGGWLGGNEEECGGYDPTEIISLTLPSGGTGGGIEYYWEYSVNGGISWLPIPGATGVTYDPPYINQSYWFRRAARRFSCGDWVFSNYCVKSVTDCPEICDNGLDDDGDGLIDCEDDDCEPVVSASGNISICLVDSTTISVSASGGTTPYEYIWDNGLGIGESFTVSPDSTTTYRVMVLSATGCIGLDSVTVSVVTCPEDCTDGIDNDGDGLIDCDDPDCQAVGQPQPHSDTFQACPMNDYQDQVTFNDDNLQQPNFSIYANPTRGSVSINYQGIFIYSPYTQFCGRDSFIYEVCNQTTGCCDTANVYINVGDDLPPELKNIPADITIGCDETVPEIPNLVYGVDTCPGIYVSYRVESTKQLGNSCQNYTISRIWEATDLCGNKAVGTQTITVEDVSAPEIFRVYTLANGKLVAGGVSKRTSDKWKYIEFPLNFTETPLVFPQIMTENESAAVTVRIRNVSEEGFEMKLQEEENADGIHAMEEVAWMAIEPGNLSGDFDLQSGILPNVSSATSNLNFSPSFTGLPAFITTMQTYRDKDPGAMRFSNLGQSSISLFIQEEKSLDAEIVHANEEVAYLAMDSGTLLDMDGTFVGETGALSLNQNWVTINLSRDFNKPVVILGGIETGNDPAVIRVRNVTSNSFEVRIQEWDYLNENHPKDKVSYMVIEGNVPAVPEYLCLENQVEMVPGVNLFAVDNCDKQLAFEYTDSSTYTSRGLHVYRKWTAVDDCGNSTDVLRTDTCGLAGVKLKIYVYGSALQTNGSGLMRDDLRAQDFVPLEEPYSGYGGFTQYGSGGEEKTSQDMMDVTGPDAIVDWVFIEIRDGDDNTKILATTSALMQRDGDVVTAEGDSVIYFPSLPEGDYFISIRHRNHLGIISDNFEYLSTENPFGVDFRDPSYEVFGQNEAGAQTNDSKRALWVGDITGDGRVIFQGPGNDIFGLFSHVLAHSDNFDHLANYISVGYHKEDLNMDGKAIYQGPNNDRSTLLYFTILAHPGNAGKLGNFIAKQKLP